MFTTFFYLIDVNNMPRVSKKSMRNSRKSSKKKRSRRYRATGRVNPSTATPREIPFEYYENRADHLTNKMAEIRSSDDYTKLGSLQNTYDQIEKLAVALVTMSNDIKNLNQETAPIKEERARLLNELEVRREELKNLKETVVKLSLSVQELDVE